MFPSPPCVTEESKNDDLQLRSLINDLTKVQNLLLLHSYDNQQVRIHPQSRKLVSVPEAMSARLRERLHKGE